ncbi:MAG: Si-specific NAD(P)(+) transhydrogenase [Pseudomonadota bacterium]
MSDVETFDFVVIGSGPAGQKAAVQAAKEGRSVALIERDRQVGGSCVYRGTIPSKTLRENALQLARAAQCRQAVTAQLEQHAPMNHLLSRLQQVLDSHDRLIADQMDRNDIDMVHGRAAFEDAEHLTVTSVDGSERRLRASHVVIATGSRPRAPEDIPVDHEYILDSDSVLSMCYLPKSMIVLGSGVIACEYASIFALLGVEVTVVDRFPSPLGFLDPELSARFQSAFESFGGRFVGKAKLSDIYWDGACEVVARMDSGVQISAEKALFALGRVANVSGLGLEKAGLELSQYGTIEVNESCQTKVPHIYAVGDVIGAPALASSSMDQGRRAVRHALGLEPGSAPHTIPSGIYTIPEIASVGLSEVAARKAHGAVKVATVDFAEVARGQIAGVQDGLLKMIADENGDKLLGCHIVGEGATELIHLAQMALVTDQCVDIFVENTFNFPTLAEAYRIGALAIMAQRPALATPTPVAATG